MEMLEKTHCEMGGWHGDDVHPVGFMLRIIMSKPKQNRQKLGPLRKACPLIGVGGVLQDDHNFRFFWCHLLGMLGRHFGTTSVHVA